ncbi:MAG: cupin domain-containing protein [Chloroflexota bacterium]|nr:cupin domain-containing protein [Chloroflexota bacterium]MDE3193010.1 cupin domain-containing protein [Chloroflexota bacterium]
MSLSDDLGRRLRGEAHDVYGWSNAPGDTYSAHSHAYTKILYCVSGSIDFRLADGTVISLGPGDRMELPSGTTHLALVGPGGVHCIEGKK